MSQVLAEGCTVNNQNRHAPVFRKLTGYPRERTTRSGLVLEDDKLWDLGQVCSTLLVSEFMSVK